MSDPAKVELWTLLLRAHRAYVDQHLREADGIAAKLRQAGATDVVREYEEWMVTLAEQKWRTGEAR